jgi:hypothetical protein
MDNHGDELREIKASLNWVTAKLQVKEGSMHGEKSILSSYNGDDKEVWKLFRRELIHDGFSSRALSKHKETIKQYVVEFGARGLLDDIVPEVGEGGNITTPGAVVIEDSFSSSATDLVERYLSTEAGQVKKAREKGSVISDIALPEGSVPDRSTLNTTSLQDDHRTSTYTLDEDDSDSGIDEVNENPRSGSRKETTSEFGAGALPKSTPGAAQEIQAPQISPRELLAIDSDGEDSSELDSDSESSDEQIITSSQSRNKHIETSDANAKAYIQPYVSEIQDEDTPIVSLERQERSLDSSIDDREIPSKSTKGADTVLELSASMVNINVDAGKKLPDISGSPNPTLIRPVRRPVSEEDDHDVPAPSERPRLNTFQHASQQSEASLE